MRAAALVLLVAACATATKPGPGAVSGRQFVTVLNGSVAATEILEGRLGPEIVADATAIRRALDSAGRTDMFQGFTMGLPRALPAELAPKWDHAMALCRELLGPRPWKGQTAQTLLTYCATTVGAYVWHQYLLHVGATQVLEFQAGQSLDTWFADGHAYGVMESSQRVSRQEGGTGAEEHRRIVQQVLDELMKGGGQVSPRIATTELGRPVEEPYADVKVAAGKVDVYQFCDRLPGELVVSPTSVLAQTVAAAWKASVKGHDGPAKCTLKAWLGEDLEFGGIVLASIDCGQGSTGGVLAQRLGPQKLAEQLVNGVVERACGR